MNRYLRFFSLLVGILIFIPGIRYNMDNIISLRPAAFEQFSPINISDSSAESTFPSLASDPTGTVHLIWTERDPVDNPFVLYSNLDQEGWTAPVDIFSSYGYYKLNRAQLLSSEDGYIHIFLDGTTGIEHSKAYAPLTGLPRNWSAPKRLFQKVTNLSDFDAAAFHQYLFVIFAITHGSGSGIYLIESDDSGINWTEARLLIENAKDDRMISQPKIALDANGKIHIIWIEHKFPESYPPIGVRYMNSLDGSNWSEVISLADGPYLEPELLCIGDREIHVVWSGVNPDRFKFHIWSKDAGESWFKLWRNESLGGLQGSPALVADSLGRIYWIQVGTIFGADRGDDLQLNIFLNNMWMPGIVIYDPPWKVSQNMKNVRAVISEGNKLTAAWMVPVTADNEDGWQMDIQVATQKLDSPTLPVKLLPNPTNTPVISSIKTSQATSTAIDSPKQIDDKIKPISIRPLNTILIGVLPAAVLVLLIIMWTTQKSNRN